MSSDEFKELWEAMQGSFGKLRDVPIDDLNIWCVDYNGLGASVSVGSCRDFCFATRRGSILVTRDRGAFMKIHREYWIRTAHDATSLALFHDADIISMLLSDQDQVATLLNSEE